jgi:hypothetical protein
LPQHELFHRFNNRLSIALGYADLVVEECPPDDPRREDFLRTQKALREAIALVPELKKLLGTLPPQP